MFQVPNSAFRGRLPNVFCAVITGALKEDGSK